MNTKVSQVNESCRVHLVSNDSVNLFVLDGPRAQVLCDALVFAHLLDLVDLVEEGRGATRIFTMN